MKRNVFLIAGIVVAVGCGAALVMLMRHGSPAGNARINVAAPVAASRGIELAPAQPMARTQAVAGVALPADSVNTQKNGQGQKTTKKKEIQDPLAREALAMVGQDPEAESYWFGAIQNTSLPKSERQDLIDDLNEEGLPDPKHPTMDDLPLLLSRLEILEDLLPWLPDGLEWEEPYSDLLNLADVATGSGRPVQ